MVNIQDWIEQKYPDQESRNRVYELHLDQPNLEGQLNLEMFPNLVRKSTIYISHFLDEKKITFLNKPDGIRIQFCNAQRAFNGEYPLRSLCSGKFDSKNCQIKRELITSVNFRAGKLEGPLIINNFPSLEKINLGDNEKISFLVIFQCPKVKEIICTRNEISELPHYSSFNLLTKLDISNNRFSKNLDLRGFECLKDFNCSGNRIAKILNFPTTLIKLNISSNNFPEQNLSIFKNLINLEELIISNHVILISCSFANRFKGTLEFLKNLTKLRILDVSYNNVDSDLEHLSKNLSNFFYSGTRIEEELEIHNGNLAGWRKVWEKKQEIEVIQELLGINKFDDLIEKLTGPDQEIWTLDRLNKEIELEQSHSRQMDKFYRQNPPSEDTQLANILREITTDYLALNLENEQSKKDNQKLTRKIESLEKLICLSKDVFLVEKIKVKEQELATFKEKLLSSREINSDVLDKLCDLQQELSCLQAKLDCELILNNT